MTVDNSQEFLIIMLLYFKQKYEMNLISWFFYFVTYTKYSESYVMGQHIYVEFLTDIL